MSFESARDIIKRLPLRVRVHAWLARRLTPKPKPPSDLSKYQKDINELLSPIDKEKK